MLHFRNEVENQLITGTEYDELDDIMEIHGN